MIILNLKLSFSHLNFQKNVIESNVIQQKSEPKLVQKYECCITIHFLFLNDYFCRFYKQKSSVFIQKLILYPSANVYTYIPVYIKKQDFTNCYPCIVYCFYGI